jgi:hypothetical protein
MQGEQLFSFVFFFINIGSSYNIITGQLSHMSAITLNQSSHFILFSQDVAEIHLNKSRHLMANYS